MTDHRRDLVLIAKEINVRTDKINGLNQELNKDPKVVAQRKQLKGHRIARDQNIIEAHDRIWGHQELGPDVTWDSWVEENLTITPRQTRRIVEKHKQQLGYVRPDIFHKRPVEQDIGVQSTALTVASYDDDDDEEDDDEDDPVPALQTKIKRLSTEHGQRLFVWHVGEARALGWVK